MWFFVKRPDSPLRTSAYQPGGDNRVLRQAFLDEQEGYCAYTERRIDAHDDSVAIEHFDATLKPRRGGGESGDGYENWYVVLQTQNQRKRRNEKRHAGASFFDSRFFQAPGGFDSRIGYLHGEYLYEERDPEDVEAIEFLAYLDLNVEERVKHRRRHIERLRSLFADADYTVDQVRAYLERHPQELHYPTVLAAELDIEVRSLGAHRQDERGLDVT